MQLNLKKIFDSANIQRIKYRQDINVLRAFAVLSVVFYHADYDNFQGGWLGVDIFFVISGFLISNIIISELNDDKFTFKLFYLRRVRRIIPGLFSLILFTLPLSYWLLTPRAMLEFTKSILSSSFFYSNYYFQNLDFYNAEPTKVMPLLHTWSLAVEEQFYIIFPLVCFLLFKYFRKYFSLLLLCLFFISFFLNSTTIEIVKFYQIQYRAWELLAGVIAMYIYQKYTLKYLNYLGYILICYAVTSFENTMLALNSIEPKLLAVIGTMLVLINNSNNKLDKYLENKFILSLGLSSYSIYLFHQPVFAFYRVFEERYFFEDYRLSSQLLILFVIVLSYFNWKYVEMVFQKVSITSLFKYISICLLIFLIFVSTSTFLNGYEDRYDYVSEDVLFYSYNTNIYPDSYESKNFIYNDRKCDIKIGSKIFCTWFKKENDKTIYLVGDSLTNSLSVSFLENLDNGVDSYNLVFIRGTAGRCILSKQSDTVGFVEECEDKFFNEFINVLSQNDENIVIAFGSFHIWISEIGQGLIKCIDCDHVDIFKERLTHISKHVSKLIIVSPNPVHNFPIADAYLYKKIEWGEPVTIALKEWEEKIYKFEYFIENLDIQNKKILETVPLFCDVYKQKLCFASKDNILLYTDQNHLTLRGANLITDEINQLISE